MENSRIPWTHHTFNGWRGCWKISEGCAGCYAWAGSKRNPAVLGEWGPNGTRVAGTEDYWRKPLRWDAAAAAAGERHRVFALSWGDWLEDWDGPVLDVQKRRLWRDAQYRWYPDDLLEGLPPLARWVTLDDVRFRLLDMIRRTQQLDWLLLTKRIENFEALLTRTARSVVGYDGLDETVAWIVDWLMGKPPANVWLGATAENQARANDQLGRLIHVPAAVRFASVEPMLEEVDLTRLRTPGATWVDCLSGREHIGRGVFGGGPRIHWVICGGESDQGGHKARPFELDWARWLRDQCRECGAAFFMKQMGARPIGEVGDLLCGLGVRGDLGLPFELVFRDSTGEDPAEWPEDLRVRELPAITAEVA